MALIFMSSEQLNLINQIHKIELMKSSITSDLSSGTITDADAAIVDMLTKKQLTLTKQLISTVHINHDCTPRKIEYKKNKGLWMTILPDRKRLHAKTEELILEKLMQYYGLSVIDTSFKTIFEEAIAHKDTTEAVNPETLYHLRSTFERFIDKSFASMDIKKITYDYIAEYTLRMLREAQYVDSQDVTHKVKKKAYMDYKSILNLTFNYALQKDIIVVSPLTKMKNKAFLKECDCSKSSKEEKIFSEDEINLIRDTVRKYMTYERYAGYFINGYAILLAIETGMRAGELPALKWSDVHDNYIHIHTQQLSNKRKGGKEYYLADWTKDEKGQSQGGRKYPLTKEIKNLLSELKSLQDRKGIHSDYIFCHVDGSWIKTDAYITCLRRLLKSLGFEITNNHAFRMSLNSNVLAGKLNLPVAKRAELLGHSVETNLKYYTYADKRDIEDLVELFDNNGEKRANITLLTPRLHQKTNKLAK